MTIVELTLAGALISVLSGVAGYITSNSRKVDEKTCLERQSHVQEFYCIKMNNINDSLDDIKEELKDLKKERIKEWKEYYGQKGQS